MNNTEEQKSAFLDVEDDHTHLRNEKMSSGTGNSQILSGSSPMVDENRSDTQFDKSYSFFQNFVEQQRIKEHDENQKLLKELMETANAVEQSASKEKLETVENQVYKTPKSETRVKVDISEEHISSLAEVNDNKDTQSKDKKEEVIKEVEIQEDEEATPVFSKNIQSILQASSLDELNKIEATQNISEGQMVNHQMSPPVIVDSHQFEFKKQKTSAAVTKKDEAQRSAQIKQNFKKRVVKSQMVYKNDLQGPERKEHSIRVQTEESLIGYDRKDVQIQGGHVLEHPLYAFQENGDLRNNMQKFKNQENSKFVFNKNLQKNVNLEDRKEFKPQRELYNQVYGAKKSARTGFLFAEHLNDVRLFSGFDPLKKNERAKSAKAPRQMFFDQKPEDTLAEMINIMSSANKQAANLKTAIKLQKSRKPQIASFSRWPSIHQLLKKIRENKLRDQELSFKDDEELEEEINKISAFEQILRKPFNKDIIKYEDMMMTTDKSYSAMMNKHIDQTAKCYEIIPKDDFCNSEIMYKKRYFLPAIFNRFYTVQIERYTKSIQKDFDELQKQNTYFNKTVDNTFGQVKKDLLNIDDQEYIRRAKANLKTQKRFAVKIQEEMAKRFDEKLRVIKEYGNSDYDEIYHYKVILYVYDLKATNKEDAKFKSRNNQQDNWSSSKEKKMSFRTIVEEIENLRPIKLNVPLTEENMVIKPVSSFELANFYSTGNENNGLLFHKNLCDSFIVNEEQGNIYFMMQDPKPVVKLGGDKTLKYTLKKIEYKNRTITHNHQSCNKLESNLSKDLRELRDLKNKILTHQYSELPKDDTNFCENFYMEFSEKDIMHNCQIFSIAQQYFKIMTPEHKEFKKMKKNFREIDLLENKVIVIAKFMSRNKISFEFRLLKNFQKLFEREAFYSDRLDKQGQLNVLSINEIWTAGNNVEMHLNVIDNQMINNYQLKFTRDQELALKFVDYKHMISYKNELGGKEISGKLIFDNNQYETYIISNEFDYNQDINQDVQQRFHIQRLQTKESMEISEQRDRQIYLDHNMILVNVNTEVTVDIDKIPKWEPSSNYEELEEKCQTNRLRNKFAQIDKRILSSLLMKWYNRQNQKKSDGTIVFSPSSQSQEKDQIQHQILVNKVQLSSDFQFLLASVHIILYQNGKAKRALRNRDIFVSLQDLRSGDENLNPGYKQEKINVVPTEGGNVSSLSIDGENYEKRRAYQVQKIISLDNQFEVKETREFDIYKEESTSLYDVDYLILRYMKKVIDIFEYVNKIQIFIFVENWKQPNPHLVEHQRLVKVSDMDFTQFEKTLSYKNFSMLILIDHKYMVSLRQTLLSIKQRDLIFEIKYLCPVYTDQLDNPWKKVDHYNPTTINMDHTTAKLEGPTLQVKDLRINLEFYSQVKSYEETQQLPDSRFQNNVNYIYGVYEDQNHVVTKVLDQMHKQEKVFFAKIDHENNEMHVFKCNNTMLEIFNMDLLDLQYIHVDWMKTIAIKGKSHDILDLRLTLTNKSFSISTFYKDGFIEVDEFLQNFDPRTFFHSRYELIQSSRINFFQMQNQITQSQINSLDNYSSELRFIKYSKTLRQDSQEFQPSIFYDVQKNREHYLFLIMNDDFNPGKFKYFQMKLDYDSIAIQLSVSYRKMKVKNHILSHENQHGIIFGCKDVPILLQHDPYTNDLSQVITARLSMIDYTKEMIIQKAQYIHNDIFFKKHINDHSQNQFFSEYEKIAISQKMHHVMQNMKRNISFEDVVKNLLKNEKLEKAQLCKKHFQRQEFIFGQVIQALHLSNSETVLSFLNEIDQLPEHARDEIMAQLIEHEDLNMKTLMEKCAQDGHASSFKVILDKFMDQYGDLKSSKDQKAILRLQNVINQLAPFLVVNLEIADYIINQKKFAFQILSRKMVCQNNKVWSDEHEQAKFANQNIPTIFKMSINDFHDKTQKQQNISNNIDQDDDKIFKYLREKNFIERSIWQKFLDVFLGLDCTNCCRRHGKGKNYSDRVEEVPIFLNSYHAIDFKMIEYGFKKEHKLFELRATEAYLPKYLRKKAKESENKAYWKAKQEKWQNFRKWLKSLKQESKAEREKRLRMEAQKDQESEDSDVNMDDFQDFKPKTNIEKLAASLPPFIENFCEKKIQQVLTLQLADFLAGHKEQSISNSSKKPEDAKLLYSKDIEAFILHQWSQGPSSVQLGFYMFKMVFFCVPFMIDGYMITSYEFVSPTMTLTEEKLSWANEDVNIDFKIVSIFAQAVLISYELLKMCASNRNKYQGMVQCESTGKFERVPVLNYSMFNCLLFFLYVPWAVESFELSRRIKAFHLKVEDNSATQDEADILNQLTQAGQFFHVLLLMVVLTQLSEYGKLFSKFAHRSLNMLITNFMQFFGIFFIFLVFNGIIGVTFLWRNQAHGYEHNQEDNESESLIYQSASSWEEIGTLFKIIRVFYGGLIFEFMSFNKNDQLKAVPFPAISALQVFIHIFIVIMMVSMFVTCLQITQANLASTHNLIQDKYDFDFIYSKALKNLEYQEIRIMLANIKQSIYMRYRTTKFIVKFLRKQKRKWLKFKSELGFTPKIDRKVIKSEAGKLWVFTYRRL